MARPAAASIDARNADRDAHLRSNDFFTMALEFDISAIRDT